MNIQTSYSKEELIGELLSSLKTDNTLKEIILNISHPVGSYYITSTDINPSVELGGGYLD